MWVAIVASVAIVLAPAPAGAPPSARLLRDGAGREVRAPARPERIVSLAPSVTEILFAVGAGDRVVGVTDFCDAPAEATTRARIGGLINPDLERIVSLKPDLAIATTAGNYRDDAERLERLGVPVYTIDTPGLEAILTTIESVGQLVGTGPKASELARGLRGRIDMVRQRAAGRGRLRALFVIEPDPLIAAGRDTFIGEALAVAGLDLLSAGGSSRWGQLDLEQVIGLAPELILTPRAHRAWAERLPLMADWANVPAVSGRRVYVVSDSIQHPGPRLVDGMEEVVGLLGGAGRP